MLPPLERPAYQSRSTGRIADMTRLRGQINADAIERRAAATAGGLQQVGAIVGNLISDYTRYAADKPQREQAAARAAEETRQIGRKRGLDEALKMGAGKPPEERIKILEQAGFALEADQMASKFADERTKTLTQLHQRVSANKTAFGKGAQILAEAQANPAMWPQVRPLLVDLASSVAPDLANSIPETYEPTQVRQILEFALATEAEADKLEKATELLKLAFDRTKAGVDHKNYFTKSLGTWLSTARSAEEWTAQLDSARELGVPSAVIESFGEWSTDAPERAAGMTMTPAEKEALDVRRVGGSDYDRYLANVAREKGKRVNDLTSAELLEAREAFTKASQPPLRTPAKGAVNASTRRLAEKDRQTAIAKLQEAQTTALDPLSEDDYNDALLDIENAYRRTLGEDEIDELPPKLTRSDPLPDDRTRPGATLPSRRGNIDLDRQPLPPPARATVASPLGAGTAEAAPAPPPTRSPQVGDIVTVNGQRIRITRIDPNGKARGVPVP